MSQLEPLIADLALILICAGAMTLLFKRLKQPVVLGYIVASLPLSLPRSAPPCMSPVTSFIPLSWQYRSSPRSLHLT